MKFLPQMWQFQLNLSDYPCKKYIYYSVSNVWRDYQKEVESQNTYKTATNFFCFLGKDINISDIFYQIQNLTPGTVFPVVLLLGRILKALSPTWLVHKVQICSNISSIKTIPHTGDTNSLNCCRKKRQTLIKEACRQTNKGGWGSQYLSVFKAPHKDDLWVKHLARVNDQQV